MEVYRFPRGGSLSIKKLHELEEKLKNVEEKEIKEKAIKTLVLKEIESHKSCLKLCKKETENRKRKGLQSQMAKLKVEERKEEEKNKTLPSSQSLYPSVTDACGPHLDCCPLRPPPYPAQDQNLTASSSLPPPSGNGLPSPLDSPLAEHSLLSAGGPRANRLKEVA